MLKETFHCDGPTCEKTTPKSHPGPGWTIRMWLSHYVEPNHPIGDKRAWHYCSSECERDHMIVLIGDRETTDAVFT